MHGAAGWWEAEEEEEGGRTREEGGRGRRHVLRSRVLGTTGVHSRCTLWAVVDIVPLDFSTEFWGCGEEKRRSGRS